MEKVGDEEEYDDDDSMLDFSLDSIPVYNIVSPIL
jgi:hypothetical protein